MSNKSTKSSLKEASASGTGSGQPPESLLKAIRALLKPLVRLLLQFQITYPYLTDLLKRLYVEVAEEEFVIPGKKQTDTRISLLTGVHRKDTRKLRGNHEESLPSLNVSQGTKLVSHWISEPKYLDPDGKPVPLPLKGEELNFESFVQEVCRQDLRARVVLDEWLRLGIVDVIEDAVHLKQEAFIPAGSLDDKAYFLGLNVADHLSAAAHNLTDTQSPFFERCVYYSELSEEAIAELDRLARDKGMDTLKALNEKALELKQTHPGEHRFNTGVYFYSEDTSSSQVSEEKNE
ncbi:MAG: DUF6502 family protein [Pseudomonadales bacterium]|nr:DUF6502 family protein [Pseudomonadales bacterium]